MRKQTEALIELMKKENIDYYCISDSDEHLSEYTSEHYHILEEFSGFTGGDGRMLVTAFGKAYLWTDGRYFIQAENELKNSGITLMRMGEPGVPEFFSFIKNGIKPGERIGFDGRCFSYTDGKKLAEIAGEGGIVLKDLCDEIWTDRPKLKITKIWRVKENFCGKNITDKLSIIRKRFSDKGGDFLIISSLDDIAWLLNLRAADVPHNPVFYAHMILGLDEAILYVDPEHFESGAKQDSVLKYLKDNGVSIKAYDDIYKDIPYLTGKAVIDPARSCYEMVSAVKEPIFSLSPVTEEKCVKNAAEIENLKIAQHKDSLALTRFMYWFKKSIGLDTATEPGDDLSVSDTKGMTECGCLNYMHYLRTLGEGFLDESFETISAYASNAAMAHYMPSEKNDVDILPKGLYLLDSGGQYIYGTTDITRTFSCGPLSEKEKECFTITVMGALRLAAQIFLEGTSGLTLDQPAREVFWRRGLNYNHGTGHGVGCLLNVHESPVGIRYKASTLEGAYPITEGMYLSDEPGFYEEGKFGIRIENLILAVLHMTTEYGRFLRFEIMSFCPIDKTCLNVKLMEPKDIELLNKYHERVYHELSGELNDDEEKWLKRACAPI